MEGDIDGEDDIDAAGDAVVELTVADAVFVQVGAVVEDVELTVAEPVFVQVGAAPHIHEHRDFDERRFDNEVQMTNMNYYCRVLAVAVSDDADLGLIPIFR